MFTDFLHAHTSVSARVCRCLLSISNASRYLDGEGPQCFKTSVLTASDNVHCMGWQDSGIQF